VWSKVKNFFSISDSIYGVITTLPGLIALVALIIYPVFYNIFVSFQKYEFGSMDKFIGLQNYVSVVTGSDFLIGWRVSGIYSLGTAGLALFVGLILAHALKRINVARGFFRTLIIIPWAVPAILSGIMWKWIFGKSLGVVNYVLSSLGLIESNVGFLSQGALALTVAIIATAYIHIPFITILVHAGLQTIPEDLYESASIDGADEFQKFWYITLPLNKFQMIFAFIIVWMFSFRTPDVVFSLTGGGPGKATYHAGLYLKDEIYHFLDYGQGAAIGVLLALSVIIIVTPVVLYTIRGGRS